MMVGKNKKSLNNIEIHEDEKLVLVFINPKIYPLEVIYSAAYAMMDRTYAIIDGDPQKEIFVELKPKDNKINLEALGRDFNNELLNYAVYMIQTARNQTVRDTIIQRAFLTNVASSPAETSAENLESLPETAETKPEETFTGKESYIDDPFGIAKPWQPPEDKKVSS